MTIPLFLFNTDWQNSHTVTHKLKSDSALYRKESLVFQRPDSAVDWFAAMDFNNPLEKEAEIVN